MDQLTLSEQDDSLPKDNGSTDRPEIPWTLNLVNNQFSIQMDEVRKELAASDTSDTDIEFLSLLTEEEQQKLSQYIEGLSADLSVEPIKICINQFDSLSYWIVSAQKLSSTLIAGFIKPIFVYRDTNNIVSYLQQLFESSHYGIVITDSETRIILCNACFEKSIMYSTDELIGQKTKIFNAKKHNRQFYSKMWEDVNNLGEWSGKILSRRKDNTLIPQQLTIQRVTSPNGKFYYFGISSDLSKSLDVIDGTQRGGIDLLTQLPSDNLYKHKVDIALKLLPKSYGLMIVSLCPSFSEEHRIEYRKIIGGSFTHIQGQVIAGFLKNEVFSIAIPYAKSQKGSHSLSIFAAIKNLFEQVKSSIDGEIYDIIANTTIGVSVLGVDAETSTRLVSHSLQAMYEKHATTNHRICFFNQTLHDKAKAESNLNRPFRMRLNSSGSKYIFNQSSVHKAGRR